MCSCASSIPCHCILTAQSKRRNRSVFSRKSSSVVYDSCGSCHEAETVGRKLASKRMSNNMRAYPIQAQGPNLMRLKRSLIFRSLLLIELTSSMDSVLPRQVVCGCSLYLDCWKELAMFASKPRLPRRTHATSDADSRSVLTTPTYSIVYFRSILQTGYKATLHSKTRGPAEGAFVFTFQFHKQVCLAT